MVSPIRPDEVPQDLICAICLSVPLNTVIVDGCSHLFCKECITESLSHQECAGQDQSCPVCRCPCTADDLMLLEDESSLSHRIWSNIAVKCDHHEDGCKWTGSLSDLQGHMCTCQQDVKQIETDKELIRRLQRENEQLKAQKQELAMRNEDLDKRYRHQNTSTVAKELDNLKFLVVHSIEIPKRNGKGGYDYDCTNVVQLTKLICQHLENKPKAINSNEIYKCVKNISVNLRRDYRENPEHFYTDTRMMLGVCLASTWFSEKQLARIRMMSDENGWA